MIIVKDNVKENVLKREEKKTIHTAWPNIYMHTPRYNLFIKVVYRSWVMAKQTVHYKSDKKHILGITDSDSGDFYL